MNMKMMNEYEWIRVDIMNQYEQEWILWMNKSRYYEWIWTRVDFMNEYKWIWMNTI